MPAVHPPAPVAASDRPRWLGARIPLPARPPHSPASPETPQPPGAASPRASRAPERWWCVSGDHPCQLLATRWRLWLLSTEARGGGGGGRGRNSAVGRHLLYNSAQPLAAWCVPRAGSQAAGCHLAPGLPSSWSPPPHPLPSTPPPPLPLLRAAAPSPPGESRWRRASALAPPLPDAVFHNFEAWGAGADPLSGDPLADLSPGCPSR